jgi:TolB-like protein/Tfp pilus assembly protein PilF
MTKVYQFGPYRLDANAEILFRGTEPLALGQRAIALLRVLVEQPGMPVSKDALIEAAWPGLAIEESNLTVQIAALRRVFAEEAGGERWIETLPRRGYRFVGPPVKADGEGGSNIDATIQPVSTLPLPDRPSIAVLPFDNLSGDPDKEYFADGMAEDIITALSRFRWFFVIARNSSFIYKGRKVDVRQIGRELGVRYVLEGSVRKGGTRLRISAQLVEAATGNHLWAEKYDGETKDVFDLQDQIAEGVVSATEPSIQRAEIERARRKRPENLDAYDLYLRALPHAWAFSPDENAKAIPLLDEALRLDPSYAAAHGLAAFCHLRGFAWGNLNDTDKATGMRHARAVLSTDTDDAMGLAFSGLVAAFLEGDFDIACGAIEKALLLNPNSAQAYGLGAAVYSLLGRVDVVIDYAQRSIRLSPFDPLRYVTLNALSRAYFLSGRYDQAIEAAQRAIQANSRFAPAYVWLIAGNARLDRTTQALEAKQRLLHIDPNFRFARWAGFVSASTEQREAIALPLRQVGVPE